MNAAVCDLVATFRPDTMFVPFIGDVHLDHQLSFLSSLVAARPRGPLAPLRLYAYETLSETHWYSPGVTAAFIPNVYIAISYYISRKIEAFSSYSSHFNAFPVVRSLSSIYPLSLLLRSSLSPPSPLPFFF